MSVKPWYSIRARGARAAEVSIYGDIGESWSEESVTAAKFVREIGALDVEELTVRINSFGGSVSDGLAMYNAIKRHKAAVTVSIDGIAASIASLVAMAGDTVEMAENALLMIHAPWGAAIGNSAAMREFADTLDTWAAAMATSYAAKTGRDQAEMLALLSDGQDHWYSAEEARDAGFADT
ncbi:MAG: head maturation protease, ClpP-related, partial [Gammaproteobacteria bacterium]